jgi:hypothetical protein
MTTLTDRVPLAAVRARADQINVARVLLTLLVGIFWLAGWGARTLFRGLAFLAAAVQLGWRDAGPTSTPARP